MENFKTIGYVIHDKNYLTKLTITLTHRKLNIFFKVK